MILQKDGEDRLDRICKKVRRITWSEGEQEYPTYDAIKRRKANWIGQILRKNSL
jgi:hypothetical protein